MTDNRTTELLRKLLDERGVEWGNIREDGTESDFFTEWQLNDSQDYAVALEWAVGGGLSVELHRHHLTPEQAIAATLGEQIVRCRDCKHATISTMGVCKYCEMFVLPDTDGYGADSQVNLPLDFFCGFAERKEVD